MSLFPQERVHLCKKAQKLVLSTDSICFPYLKLPSSKTPKSFTKQFKWEDNVAQPERVMSDLAVVWNEIASVFSFFKSRMFWANHWLTSLMQFSKEGNGRYTCMSSAKQWKDRLLLANADPRSDINKEKWPEDRALWHPTGKRRRHKSEQRLRCIHPDEK